MYMCILLNLGFQMNQYFKQPNILQLAEEVILQYRILFVLRGKGLKSVTRVSHFIVMAPIIIQYLNLKKPVMCLIWYVVVKYNTSENKIYLFWFSKKEFTSSFFHFLNISILAFPVELLFCCIVCFHRHIYIFKFINHFITCFPFLFDIPLFNW